MDRGKIISAIVLILLGFSVNQNANANEQLMFSADQIQLKQLKYDQQGVLKLSGPNGVSQTYQVYQGQSLIPVYELNLKEDGLYEYELILFTEKGEETVTDPRNGRVNAKRNLGTSEKVYGSFSIVNGRFVEEQSESEDNINSFK